MSDTTAHKFRSARDEAPLARYALIAFAVIGVGVLVAAPLLAVFVEALADGGHVVLPVGGHMRGEACQHIVGVGLAGDAFDEPAVEDRVLHSGGAAVAFFAKRKTGDIFARFQENQTIRAFLTGQGLFSALDILFTIVFLIVLFIYSWKLTLIVVASIPLYALVAVLARPILRDRIDDGHIDTLLRSKRLYRLHATHSLGDMTQLLDDGSVAHLQIRQLLLLRPVTDLRLELRDVGAVAGSACARLPASTTQ
mgnify:CR=1 FL=1